MSGQGNKNKNKGKRGKGPKGRKKTTPGPVKKAEQKNEQLSTEPRGSDISEGFSELSDGTLSASATRELEEEEEIVEPITETEKEMWDPAVGNTLVKAISPLNKSKSTSALDVEKDKKKENGSPDQESRKPNMESSDDGIDKTSQKNKGNEENERKLQPLNSIVKSTSMDFSRLKKKTQQEDKKKLAEPEILTGSFSVVSADSLSPSNGRRPRSRGSQGKGSRSTSRRYSLFDSSSYSVGESQLQNIINGNEMDHYISDDLQMQYEARKNSIFTEDHYKDKKKGKKGQENLGFFASCCAAIDCCNCFGYSTKGDEYDFPQSSSI